MSAPEITLPPMLAADANGKFRSALPEADRTTVVHLRQRHESSAYVALACSCGVAVGIRVGEDERKLEAAFRQHLPAAS